MVTREKPLTVGALRSAVDRGLHRYPTVKDELRGNLITKLQAGEPLFPGIIGYDETVVPQLVNALLSKHNFILLGLRGQAKTRILRSLVDLLDEAVPVVPGCEIHDDPLAPLCSACRARAAAEGDALPVTWLTRDERYVEKLATPDVTIADMLGDIDPIRRRAADCSSATTSRCTMACCRVRTAASLPSTSCPISPARSRLDSSTSCRKVTSRSKATRCASGWT